MPCISCSHDIMVGVVAQMTRAAAFCLCVRISFVSLFARAYFITGLLRKLVNKYRIELLLKCLFKVTASLTTVFK
jgi:hypothetical protein